MLRVKDIFCLWGSPASGFEVFGCLQGNSWSNGWVGEIRTGRMQGRLVPCPLSDVCSERKYCGYCHAKRGKDQA